MLPLVGECLVNWDRPIGFLDVDLHHHHPWTKSGYIATFLATSFTVMYMFYNEHNPRLIPFFKPYPGGWDKSVIRLHIPGVWTTGCPNFDEAHTVGR